MSCTTTQIGVLRLILLIWLGFFLSEQKTNVST
ncbi:hypothetical protein PVAP13_7NG385025 [Panicum virgatum]|uniref:Uncharacterized protein n=1 Tax=Panicum virgatum TaxID=38727 RepID=A0A8T0QEE8_PANVG|nr:hypothetical protein PVAP13_7NG385025 [Panicum virgatum]